VTRPLAPKWAQASPFEDTEQAAFIDGLPIAMTFSGIASACLGRFGPERAWPRHKIGDYWFARHGTNLRSRFSRDPEIAVYVEDRAGRWTIKQLRAGLIATFGAERAPSRTAIGDFVQHLCGASRKRLNGSEIDGDLAVRTIVEAARGHMGIKETVAACRSVLGADRVPTPEMVRRHWLSMPGGREAWRRPRNRE
jgi:hypothetical protein